MEIAIGALTYHHFSIKPQRHFEKCIGDCQAIVNPLIDLGIGKHHLFTGANSIGRFMSGYRHNITLNDFTSLTVGGYYQNNGEFKDKGIDFAYNLGDVIPLVGLDFNYKSIGVLVSYPLSVMYWKFN
jgi:hypothetical protein